MPIQEVTFTFVHRYKKSHTVFIVRYLYLCFCHDFYVVVGQEFVSMCIAICSRENITDESVSAGLPAEARALSLDRQLVVVVFTEQKSCAQSAMQCVEYVRKTI